MSTYKESSLARSMLMYLLPSMLYYAVRSLFTEITLPILKSYEHISNALVLANSWLIIRSLLSIFLGWYVIRTLGSSKGWIGKFYNQKRALVVFGLFVAAFEINFVLRLLESIT